MVERVEQDDDLQRTGAGRQHSETHDVAEVDGDGVEVLGVDGPLHLQLLCHALGQHLVQQGVGPVLLDAQLLRLLGGVVGVALLGKKVRRQVV